MLKLLHDLRLSTHLPVAGHVQHHERRLRVRILFQRSQLKRKLTIFEVAGSISPTYLHADFAFTDPKSVKRLMT